MGIRLVKSVADRYLAARIQARDVVNNLDDLKDYLKHTIGFKDKEHFATVLDAKNRELASEILFSGRLISSSLYPGKILSVLCSARQQL